MPPCPPTAHATDAHCEITGDPAQHAPRTLSSPPPSGIASITPHQRPMGHRNDSQRRSTAHPTGAGTALAIPRHILSHASLSTALVIASDIASPSDTTESDTTGRAIASDHHGRRPRPRATAASILRMTPSCTSSRMPPVHPSIPLARYVREYGGDRATPRHVIIPIPLASGTRMGDKQDIHANNRFRRRAQGRLEGRAPSWRGVVFRPADWRKGAAGVTRKEGEGTEGEEGEIDAPRTSQQYWILRDGHWTRASPMQKAAASTNPRRSNDSDEVISDARHGTDRAIFAKAPIQLRIEIKICHWNEGERQREHTSHDRFIQHTGVTKKRHVYLPAEGAEGIQEQQQSIILRIRVDAKKIRYLLRHVADDDSCGYRGLLVPVPVLDINREIPIAMFIRQEFVRRASQS
ncbi:hypothetical protein B0H14DRAFT_2574587 [Mycena olivaceomarginata]|nr:hypothetical protein B0H14DRAFT_2574587 [Mycena olivaceomarginata]